MNAPFHEGEQALQARVGKREIMEKVGHKAIRDFMPEQHRQFYQMLPFMVVGGVDTEGWPWASIVSGMPGFIHSPSPTELHLTTKAHPKDPINTAIKMKSPLGLLGIDMMSRRRNRMNGYISDSDEDSFVVTVDQSFGNCPQYIQNWDIEFVRDPNSSKNTTAITFTSLNDKAKNQITATDTFFVTSYNNTEDDSTIKGVDVSHRGGKAGFVKVEGNTLTIPDYAGNFFFNTLGNFLVNPKAGLSFIDFETGNLLMLTGAVEILWEKTEEIKAFKGAERAWRFTLHHGIELIDALPFRGIMKAYSSQVLSTGEWPEKTPPQ